MSLLDAITHRSSDQALSLRDPALIDLFGGRETISGARITPKTALNISGWYAGVRILSETIASLQKVTYKRGADGSKARAVDHPVYKLLHDKPNPFMTAVEYFEAAQGHVLGWGNHFSEIQRDGTGKVVALWPLPPDRVRIQIMPDRLWYYVRAPMGEEIQLRQEQVLHIRSLAGEGIIGYSPVDLQREALGLAKIEEEYRARFFKNDARPSGIVEIPGQLSDPAFQRLKGDIAEKYAGIGNKFRVMLLEEGSKWHDVGFPPATAEFIEGRKFQLEEIARILGVPLILLQSTEKATSWGTGIEQFMLQFMQFTIRPWLKRWEARINASLFTEQEQKSYYVEALIDDLLRADSRARAETLAIWRRNGIINANDWLALENRNPLPGPEGKIYVIEGNMTRLEDVGLNAREVPVSGANAPAAPAAGA